MHLRRFEIRDLRVFGNLSMRFGADPLPGWHVILGNNGSGKSTLLRALSLALTGPREATAAQQPVEWYLRSSNRPAQIELNLAWDGDWDSWSGTGRKLEKSFFHCGISLSRDDGIKATDGKNPYSDRTIWSSAHGWFSAAFGPFRRFSGGRGEDVRVYTSYPRLARHLSAFSEGTALTEALEWLKQLRFRELEQSESGGQTVSLLDRVRTFVNQPGFLPHAAQLSQVTSEGAEFTDGNGVTVPVLELSDGYRSVLSMTFELIRLMAACYGEERLFDSDSKSVIAPGVVMIDEVDVHLHPEWQRRIGEWFCRLFPNVQFLVTTHSPFVCQQAIRGTLWKLPTPGTQEELRQIEGEERVRVLYGDVLDVLGSSAFGGAIGRSERATVMLDRLAVLNKQKILRRATPAELTELSHLRSQLQPVLPNLDLDVSEAAAKSVASRLVGTSN